MSSAIHKNLSTDNSPALHAAPDKGAGAAARATQSQLTKGTQSNGQGTDEASKGQDDGGSGQRPGPVGENQNAVQAGQEKVILPTHERFEPSWPKAAPTPAPQVSPDLPKVCGACPAWYRPHSQAPFGQCTAAIRWLGAPVYTTDLSMCSYNDAQRQKEARR